MLPIGKLSSSTENLYEPTTILGGTVVNRFFFAIRIGPSIVNTFPGFLSLDTWALLAGFSVSLWFLQVQIWLVPLKQQEVSVFPILIVFLPCVAHVCCVSHEFMSMIVLVIPVRSARHAFHSPIWCMFGCAIHIFRFWTEMLGVSWNGGTPKLSIFIGCSIVHHPLEGIPIYVNLHFVGTHIGDTGADWESGGDRGDVQSFLGWLSCCYYSFQLTMVDVEYVIVCCYYFFVFFRTNSPGV